MLGKVVVKSELAKRGLVCDDKQICLLCKLEQETVNHLFFTSCESCEFGIYGVNNETTYGLHATNLHLFSYHGLLYNYNGGKNRFGRWPFLAII